MADGEGDLRPSLDGLPVVDDGFTEEQEFVFNVGDVLWSFCVGDEADFHIFLLGSSVDLESSIFIPVEDYFDLFALFPLKGEVPGGYGWVF